jgi:predicted GNAT superfamily acetyltransferase
MEEIVIRECTAIDELDHCVRLQRDVFGLPDLEISPRRHLIVSRQAGGWTLGAFASGELVGFVHTLAGVRNGNEIFGYSHVMAVAPDYQNKGVGARLKWSQRERALREGRSFIKWTWDPMQARNAHFNLNRLGVTVSSYTENFYGTDYPANPVMNETEATGAGIDSDRLFADWQLESAKVKQLAPKEKQLANATAGDIGSVSSSGSATIAATSAGQVELTPAVTIDIPANWSKLCKENPGEARDELLRVRREFQEAFAARLIAAGFERSPDQPRYLLYTRDALRANDV